jgi:hypothetical protein
VTWISVSEGVRTETAADLGYRPMDKTIFGGKVVTLSAPYKGGWIAALVKADSTESGGETDGRF